MKQKIIYRHYDVEYLFPDDPKTQYKMLDNYIDVINFSKLDNVRVVSVQRVSIEKCWLTDFGLCDD